MGASGSERVEGSRLVFLVSRGSRESDRGSLWILYGKYIDITHSWECVCSDAAESWVHAQGETFKQVEKTT